MNKLKEWKIITAEDAIPPEMYAAQMFQQCIRQCVGFEIKIMSDTGLASDAIAVKNTIYIGQGPWLKNVKESVDISSLGEEGLYIRINEDQIFISGGRTRGTLYGVYEFAERYLGMRFLTYDHTYIPDKTRWIIPCEEYRYVPCFSFRWSYYGENSEHPEFSSKLRVNTTTPRCKIGADQPSKA